EAAVGEPRVSHHFGDTYPINAAFREQPDCAVDDPLPIDRRLLPGDPHYLVPLVRVLQRLPGRQTDQSGRCGISRPGARPSSTARVTDAVPYRRRTPSTARSSADRSATPNG